MATVVRVTESWKQQGGSSEGIPGLNAIRQQNCRVFTVKFSGAAVDNAQVAMSANDGTTAIPAQGSLWPGVNAPWLVCRRVHVLNPQGPTLFHVIAEYSGLVSPFAQAPLLEYAGMKHSEEVSHAADGAAYVNSIGIRLTDCYRDFYDKIFTLTRNEPNDSIVGGDWRGVVNSETLTLGNFTWAPKKVKIDDIRAHREYMPAGNVLGTISAIAASGSTYAITLTGGAMIVVGTKVSCSDGTGNSISGTIASNSGSQSILSATGLTVTGNPTLIPSGTNILVSVSGGGINYFYVVTYVLAVRTHVVTINGGSAQDIGWQTLRPNNSPAYMSGGQLLNSMKNPPFLPEVLIHQDGTLWTPTWQGGSDTISTLYWLLFNDYLPQDFTPLGLST